MDTFSTVVKFFQDCGLFIYPSALIMALGIAISIERFLFLTKARNQNRKVWAEVLPMLQKGQFRDVQGVISRSDAAVSKIVNYGLTRMQSPGRREDYDAAMEEGMMEIVPRLEKRTHYIATFANVITLVGLLGTIIGLIKGFTAVAQVNPAEKAEMLSASISIAMNNTAFALMVAIPFLLIHSFLQAKTSEIVDGLEAAKISFLNLVQRLRAEQPAPAHALNDTRPPRRRHESPSPAQDAGPPRDHRVHQPDRGARAVPAVDRGVHPAGGDRPGAAGAIERRHRQARRRQAAQARGRDPPRRPAGAGPPRRLAHRRSATGSRTSPAAPTPRRWRCWCRRSRPSSRSTTTPPSWPRPTPPTRRW